jgi:hypothetical protein
MATELKNIKRLYGLVEASITLLAKQWAYAEDTRRITVMEDDGTTRRYFWDSTRLADQSGTYGAAVIGIDGITGITPDGGSSGSAATLRAMLRGAFGTGNSNFVSVAPNSSTRNLVQPSGDYIGLRLRMNASQSNEILRVENSASVRVAYVDAQGHWYTSWAQAGQTNIIAVGNTDNTNTGSHAQLLAVSGGASGGDPKFTAQVTGAGVMSLGIDNSDSDAAVLSMSTALGTNNAQRWTTAGTTIPGTLGVTGLVTGTAGFVSGNADALLRNTATEFLHLGGSTATNVGANLILYGQSHATLPSYWRLRRGTTIDLEWNGTSVAITPAVTMASTMGVTGLITATGGISLPDGQGLTSEISASTRDLVARSGTTLLVGENGGWTAAQYRIASGTHDMSIGGATQLSVSTAGASITGTLGVSGLITATGGVLISGGSGGQGRIIYDAGGFGLAIRARTGAVYDFTLTSANDTTLLSVPTGTIDLEIGHVAGAITLSSPVTMSSDLDVAGTVTMASTLSVSSTLTLGGDANLYRAAANVLKTDDALDVSGAYFIIPRLAAAPGTPSNGMMYYNTVDNHFYFRANAVWVEVA